MRYVDFLLSFSKTYFSIIFLSLPLSLFLSHSMLLFFWLFCLFLMEKIGILNSRWTLFFQLLFICNCLVFKPIKSYFVILNGRVLVCWPCHGHIFVSLQWIWLMIMIEPSAKICVRSSVSFRSLRIFIFLTMAHHTKAMICYDVFRQFLFFIYWNRFVCYVFDAVDWLIRFTLYMFKCQLPVFNKKKERKTTDKIRFPLLLSQLFTTRKEKKTMQTSQREIKQQKKSVVCVIHTRIHGMYRYPYVHHLCEIKKTPMVSTKKCAAKN